MLQCSLFVDRISFLLYTLPIRCNYSKEMLWKNATKISNRIELCLEQVCSQVVTFCNSHSLKEGFCIHSSIIKLGLKDDLFLNNNLLSVYAKCFGVEHARKLFDEMPHKDVVSWTGMLSACVKRGNHELALEFFDRMKIAGQSPNEFTLSTVLRSCSELREFNRGTQIQCCMIKQGYEANPVLASNLINLYSKCGCTTEAYEVFTNMEYSGDTVSWTMMISSFVESQNWIRALQIYSRMIKANVSPNEYTFTKLLSACSSLGLYYGKLIHAHLIMWGVKLNLVLKTAVVDMYAKCQMMEDALKVSNQTPERDLFLWTSIISGFTQNSKFTEAFAAFRDMGVSGISPNNYTYSGILNACSSMLELELGKQVHKHVIIAGLENDVSVGNALVDMYMKCSKTVEDGVRVFRGITSPNVISWTSLIAGLAEHGLEQESFRVFEEMRFTGEDPNRFTLSTILGACGTIDCPNQTRKIHGYIIKASANSDIIVGNALVDTYARSGKVDDAWSVIKIMSCRDAITYTTLATQLNQMGDHEAALDIIALMHEDDVKMDGFSLASFLSASAGLGAVELGKQLHCYSVKSGLGKWISVSNGLVVLYGKCGRVHDAQRVFDEMSEPDVVSWNGLIFGLALNGYISPALSAFEDMRLAGIKPDCVTFLSVLFACSHGGLVDLGLDYFHSMREKHEIEPKLDHYVCLIDLLGRAGRLEEAMTVIETMPFKPDALIYKTLLAACKLHGNIPLGEDMASRALELDQSDPAIYVLLADMYDNFGWAHLGEKTRVMMRERGLRKNPGQSWMEIRNKVQTQQACR